MYAAENPKFSAEIAGKQSFFVFGKYSFELVKKQFGQARCETWGSVALVLCCPCTNVNQGRYRTKSVWRLCTPSACKFPFRACFVSSRTHLACIFSEIFRENTRKSTKDFLRFSLHLSKNLTTQSAYVRYETDSHISQKCS